MAKKRTYSEIGPTGRRVAENLRRLRDARRITTMELAERVCAQGVPMSAFTVTRIEKLGRRVTVDELTALADALGVRTVQLLRDPDADPLSEIAALADELLSGPLSVEITMDETGVRDVVTRIRREAVKHIVRTRLAEAKRKGRPTMADVRAPETDYLITWPPQEGADDSRQG